MVACLINSLMEAQMLHGSVPNEQFDEALNLKSTRQYFYRIITVRNLYYTRLVNS